MRLLAYLGVQHVCGLMLLTRTKADVFRVKECNTNNNNLIYIHIYIYNHIYHIIKYYIGEGRTKGGISQRL